MKRFIFLTMLIIPSFVFSQEAVTQSDNLKFKESLWVYQMSGADTVTILPSQKFHDFSIVVYADTCWIQGEVKTIGSKASVEGFLTSSYPFNLGGGTVFRIRYGYEQRQKVM